MSNEGAERDDATRRWDKPPERHLIVRPPASSAAARLRRAWLLTALVDGLFSSALSAFFYGSTVARLWQGVASVLIGPGAMNQGSTAVGIGLAMHLTTALTWSTVFLLLYMQSAWLRGIVASRWGRLKVAAAYGPCIWLVMSLVVIPVLAHRPPSITVRWWVQFFGHMIFVALPIVAMIGTEGRDRVFNVTPPARS